MEDETCCKHIQHAQIMPSQNEKKRNIRSYRSILTLAAKRSAFTFSSPQQLGALALSKLQPDPCRLLPGGVYTQQPQATITQA